MKAFARMALGAIVGTLYLAGPGGAHAQTYPDRSIRFVVPFAPGGSTDVLARRLAMRVAKPLGQSIVVDNRAGAAGAIGCTEVARAKPDGYTLLMGTSGTHAINPTTMVKPTYDAVADFTPVAIVGSQPFSFAVHPSVPAKNLQELVTLLKANPGKYSYASAGAGGIAHLTGELFKSVGGGLDAAHVPYKGGGPALQDVLAGHVAILSDSFSTTYPQHKAGKLRVLFMTGEARSAAAPDIPTAIESGMPRMISATAGIVLGPAGMPQSVVDTLQKAIAGVMQEADFRKELEGLSIDPVTDSTPAKTGEFIRREIAKWAPIIRATGTKME